MARVEFIDAAIEDLRGLDHSIVVRVLKKIRLLQENPEAGLPLGHRAGRDLTTFRKLVVGNRDWRIIYRVEPDGTVAVVWVIGPRSDEECYREARARLERLGNSPQARALDAIIDQVVRASGPQRRKRRR